MFEKYADLIKEMNKFEKENILNKKFELYNNSNIKIFYAPHNEIINKNAKIFIVGITPGWTQTRIAYQTAHKGLKDNLSYEQIKKNCKKNSRFAGSMRKNLVQMLDKLELNNYLQLESCSKLFEENDNLLHTTSLIPYPVFINNKNYTGSNPKITENKILWSYIENFFYKEYLALPNTLIIPLEKTVKKVLKILIEKNLINKKNCLLGFPHPSGANGHRQKQFEKNKNSLSTILKNYFKKQEQKRTLIIFIFI